MKEGLREHMSTSVWKRTCRRLLLFGGLLAAGATVAACSSGSLSASDPTTTTTRPPATTTTRPLVTTTTRATVAPTPAGKPAPAPTTTTAPVNPVTLAINAFQSSHGPATGWMITSTQTSAVDASYVLFKLGPAPGYQNSYQGGYGFVAQGAGAWSVVGFGTVDVGCASDGSTQPVVPSAVIRGFGLTCSS
jgi:hypothetical protein